MRKSTLLLVQFFISTLLAFSQSTDGRGLPQFSTTIPVPNGAINVGTGNLYIEIPIVDLPQRGGQSVGLKLVYNSKNTRPFGQSLGNKWLWSSGWALSHYPVASVSADNTSQWCPNQQIYSQIYSNFRSFDSRTASSQLYPGMNVHSHICSGGATSDSESSADQTGYYITATTGQFASLVSTLWDRSGNKLTPQFQDTNGNTIGTSPGLVITTDTLGRLPYTVTYDGLFHYVDVRDSQNNLVRYTMEYMDANVKTAFNVYSYAECCDTTVRVLKSLTLPGSAGQYTFTYDTGTTPGNYGQLQSMTLPSGGTVTFTYSTFGTGTLQTRWVASYGTPDGNTTFSVACGTGNPCNPIYTANWPTSPSSSTVYTVNAQAVVTRIDNSEAGVLKARQDITYNLNGYVGGYNPVPNSKITTLYQNGSPSLFTKTEYTYTNGTLPADVKEWDFYTGAPSATPTRKTSLLYAPPTSTNMLDRVSSRTVFDQNNAQVSRTEYIYDDYSNANGLDLSLLDRGIGIIGHVDSYGPGFATRGNLSREKRWIRDLSNASAPVSWAETKHRYDTLGNRVKTIDEALPTGHATDFSYNDKWNAFNCVAANTFAYLTEVTNAKNQRGRSQYYPCTGLLQATADENDILASRWGQTNTYDALNRPLTGTFADGGQTITSYDDAQHLVIAKQLRSGSSYTVNRSHLDGLGRIWRNEICEDGLDSCGASIKVDTTFNSMGQVASVSNPYRVTSELTYGVTNWMYDWAGRVTKVTHPDGFHIDTSFTDNCSTVADENSRSSKRCLNAFGLLKQVYEDPATLNYATFYSYDALGNLVCVEQRGNQASSTANCADWPNGNFGGNWRVRKFTYDSLSQLLTEKNPESGSATYTYDVEGNELTKTDARGVVTTSAYDELHRLISQTFTDTTPSHQYAYDSYPNIPSSNSIGRLVVQWGGGAQTVFGYDPVGRIIQQKQWLPPNYYAAYDVTASYDLAGNLDTLTYPSGRVVRSHFDTANRLDQVKFDNFNGTNVGYVYWQVPSSYQSLPGFYPNGMTRWEEMAPVGSPATVTRQFLNLNNRLWYKDNTLNRNGTYLFSRSYSYMANGNITAISDNLDSTKSQNFRYDNLNRIVDAWTNASTGSEAWANNFVIDAWGNLNKMQACTRAECNGKPLGQNLNVTSDGNNRFVGFSYDASGNMLNDGSSTFTFDAGNRPKSGTLSGTTTTNVYDSGGLRVRKEIGSDYIEYLYFGSEVIAEKNQTGTWSDYIFAGKRRIAKAPPTVATTGTEFYHADHLGSTRTVTDYNGIVINSETYLPFGKSLTNNPTNHYRYAGKERDGNTGESGLDYFIGRFNSSNLGRFISPDPANASAITHLEQPQSWNGYSYTGNNPLTFVDPSGEEYLLCESDGIKFWNCLVLSDPQYDNLKKKQKKAGVQFGEDGLISNSSGQVFAYAVWLGPDANPGTLEAFSAVSRDAGPPVRFLAGLTLTFVEFAGPGVLSRSAAMPELMTSIGRNLFSNLTKAGAKKVVEDLAISQAQKAALKRALRNAKLNQTINLDRLADGSVRLTRVRAGTNGSQHLVHVIGADGTTSTFVQVGINSQNVVDHYHVKK